MMVLQGFLPGCYCASMIYQLRACACSSAACALTVLRNTANTLGACHWPMPEP